MGSAAADAATAAASSAASSTCAAGAGMVSVGADSVDWGAPSFSSSLESPNSECDLCEPVSALFPDFFEDFFPGFFFLPPIASAPGGSDSARRVFARVNPTI